MPIVLVCYSRLQMIFLDVTGTIEELGKTPGSDIRQDKSTYVSLLGLDEARNEAHVVAQKAHAALATIDAMIHIY